MFSGWFQDLERAIAALKEKTHFALFSSITVNMFGDFIIISNNRKFIVTHDEQPKVYECLGDWKKSIKIEL